MKNLKECDTCGKKDRQKNLKKINGEWRCISCNSKKRKEHREFLKREICGIRKRNNLRKEWIEKRKLKESISKRHEREMKKIKGSKFSVENYKKLRVYGRRPQKTLSLSLYITRNEKDVLYRILTNKGYSSKEANDHIRLISIKMEELSKKLNKEKRKKEDINIVFKEEFAKLIDRS